MKSIRSIKKEVKTVEWQIADKCNYRCSYCNAKIWQSRYPPLVNSREFLDKLHKFLRGGWLIHFGGYGEPFVYPEFLKIVKELVSRDYYIGLVTNFSYPSRDILKFCEITKGKLLYFNASLHLEFVNPRSFLRKAIKIKEVLGPLFGVSTVARKEKLPELIKVGEEFTENGIEFILQAEKIGRNYCDYSENEIAQITQKIGYTYAMAQENKFKGKECFAGKDYFILDNDGEAYCCNPYRGAYGNIANKTMGYGYLGNILKGTFNLREKDIVCKLEICSCSTPWRVRGWRSGPEARL